MYFTEFFLLFYKEYLGKITANLECMYERDWSIISDTANEDASILNFGRHAKKRKMGDLLVDLWVKIGNRDTVNTCVYSL